MSVKFLSPEWADAFTAALNNDEAFAKAIRDVKLTLAYQVMDGPEGEIDYYVRIADGAATAALGTTDDADVTITSDHETAIALQRGELNPQAAFMTGKIKVSGNLALLMMNQSVLSAFSTVAQGLDVEF